MTELVRLLHITGKPAVDTAETGRVVLGSTTGSPGDVLIELPLPGPFRVRAFRNSRATADDDFPEMSHHDEQWLIQAWPTG